MPKRSAGVLLFRKATRDVEVLLVHPGGPFWRNKDDGSWSIPKGEHEPDEAALAAARRELAEETGLRPEGDFIALGTCKSTSGKLLQAWAIEADCDPAAIVSNTFAIEWPKGSGRKREFPEVDCAAWFDLATARRKINSAQTPFLDALAARLRHKSLG